RLGELQLAACGPAGQVDDVEHEERDRAREVARPDEVALLTGVREQRRRRRVRRALGGAALAPSATRHARALQDALDRPARRDRTQPELLELPGDRRRPDLGPRVSLQPLA